VIISIDKQRVPRVPPTDRLVIDDLGYTDDGITHVSARFGYMDAPNAPEVLRLLETADIECPIEVDYGLVLRLHDRAASWHRQDHGPMAQRLFLATSAITVDVAEYFNLPRDRTVIVGSQVEV